MADQNPTAGPRVVPIHLPDAQAGILKGDLLDWLAGIEHDLARFRGGLRDPQATVREAEAFRRLLVALDSNEIELPDDDARTALAGAADGYDDASGYTGIAAVHDAHHALLAILTTAEVGL
jgi:hypothetical protein